MEGSGRVANISSQGLAFRTEVALEPGSPINASMEWPVALNGACALRISIEGHVVRVADGLAVMSVERYEFRTGGRLAAASPEMAMLKRQVGEMLAGAGA